METKKSTKTRRQTAAFKRAFEAWMVMVRKFHSYSGKGIPDVDVMTDLLHCHRNLLCVAKENGIYMDVMGVDPANHTVYEHASWLLSYSYWDTIVHLNFQLPKNKFKIWSEYPVSERRAFGKALNVLALAFKHYDEHKEFLREFRDIKNGKNAKAESAGSSDPEADQVLQ
ncbi:hypothetical protein [Pseudomonas phage PA1C]|uniref:Uncharacterized protein n=1 Tax=Pseudomonas phage vB_PaeM_PS119XW TaxID=2601632 RepID=A0A5C1K7D2_9CAUD|nr:hypothetical protein PP933_gp349 [Pseudomonas phage vB_PaeM_PS119XW]QBX32506.1 hypothetical protein [Pseudomonas phage PA1C]QEM42078.1 hypothetical protein [Pseudomonas phage vB_PaeM_PS119XW]